MISLLKTLFYFDWLSLKNWFSKETISKLLIVLIFLFIVGGVASLLWVFSSTFFTYLSTLEPYGQYTSLYIIKATTLTILWIGIISVLISTITFLLTTDRRIDYVITLPTDFRVVLLWNGLKSLIINILLFCIFVLPMALAYLRKIGFVETIPGIGRILLLLFFISIISNTIGSSLGFIIANRFKKKDGFVFTLIAILLIVTLTVLLFKAIFPVQLTVLSGAPITDFVSLYNSLPLNQYCYLNTLLSQILISGWGIHILYLSVFSLVILFIDIVIQKTLFIETWQQTRINLKHHLYVFKLTPSSRKTLDLSQKDYISILRSPKDLGYQIFLLVLLIAFIGLFSRGIEVNRIPGNFTPSLIVFSWIWLSFYAITYLMRMCYPLMSKEGKTRWWLFTLPIKTSSILNSKITTGLILSLPLYLIAIAEWWFVPFVRSPLFLSVISIFSLLSFVVIITNLGIIKPEYSLADDPEKASTGLSGIFALTLSLLVSGFSGLLIFMNATNRLSQLSSINIFLIFAVIFITLLYFWAYRSLKGHSVEMK